jgi:polysaccharide deacetylase family protein (PEP-CTERM system associated)
MNAISIDLEDWFCAYNLRIPMNEWDSCELRVEKSTFNILRLLEKHKVKATFFVLGWIAERVPDLIKEIHNKGHEIASHGYSHRLITSMTVEEFDDDIKRSLNAIKLCINSPVLGYRAPSFTITQKTLWAIDVLVNNGMKYDSSIFPIGFHPDYGIADSPLGAHEFMGLTEVPLSVAEIFGKRVPCSGGGYFRLFPYSITKTLMKKCNEQGRPVIFYLHPWETDIKQPRKDMPLLNRFRHYNNLGKTEQRLDKLLSDFKFSTIKSVLGI